MLKDLKEQEEQELENWNRLKRFDKIARLRQEQGFEQEENREKIPAWRTSKRVNIEEIEKSTVQSKNTPRPVNYIKGTA